MLDMVDTHTDTDMLDTMASVKLMLSLRPRLIPIFCMEAMAMAMLVTLAMLDTMDIPMLDMPTMDKLHPPKQEKDRATIIVFFFSDHKLSVLDLLFGNGWQKRTEQPSLFSSSVTTNFQCLTCFLVTDGRKHRATIIVFFFSDNKISVLDLLFGNGWQD